MSVPPRPFELCLVGAGKAGTAVASALAAAGNRVIGVASRSETSAEAAAGLLGAPVVAPDALPPCDVVLLGVPDAAVAQVAESIVSQLRPGTVVWHLSGALGIAALPSSGGVLRAALHPVQVFPDRTARAPVAGCSWGVTCDEGLTGWVREVVAGDLRGNPVTLGEDERPVWHAASVTTANGITALLSLAETLLESIGVAETNRVLGPLAASAVSNSIASGASASLTGPAVRDEWGTVTEHVRAIEASAPELLDPYREATRLIFRAADRAGKVSADGRLAAASILGEAR